MTELRPADGQTIGNIEDRNIYVAAGVSIVIDGIAKGELRVEAGGRVEVTGMLQGDVLLNDGAIYIAEGAFFGDRVMTRFGLERQERPVPATVSPDSPRHKLVGVRGGYGVQT